ncbi:sulfotransferase domain-containing protein [Umezawaea endophytica]|uniref:Sulfotransferase domain-containing protein n=1 Tax=Umezawaea endophytica TaxID=1654476 RepID=A0A9X2VII9_9PSEU|nr:sulfotransferase domain-containing protein [Umezawaea endophytica]MCS7477019.1 sulfotransferase domain-containing protein [Umezawaea endophytica]
MPTRPELTMRERHVRNAAMVGAQDIIVAAYPASGAALLGNILMELGHTFIDPHFDELDEQGRIRVPSDEELRSHRDRIAANSLSGSVGGRRFFKNHLDPTYFTDAPLTAVVLLVRDPRDALHSSFRFFQEFAPTLLSYLTIEKASFLEYLDGLGDEGEPPLTVEGWVEFYRAWTEVAERLPCSAVVRFEELKTTPVAAVVRLLDALGSTADPAAVEHAVERSSFERMRAHEEKVAGANQPMIMRSGRVDEWREWYGDGELSDRFRVPRMIEMAARFGYEIQ